MTEEYGGVYTMERRRANRRSGEGRRSAETALNAALDQQVETEAKHTALIAALDALEQVWLQRVRLYAGQGDANEVATAVRICRDELLEQLAKHRGPR
jgi:hypothetical protein